MFIQLSQVVYLIIIWVFITTTSNFLQSWVYILNDGDTGKGLSHSLSTVSGLIVPNGLQKMSFSYFCLLKI